MSAKRGNNYLSLLNCSVMFMSLCLVFSCSIGPRTRFIQKSPNFNEAMGNITRLGIISDATIVASSDADDQSNNIYVSIEDSKAVESQILTNAARYMKQKGYDVAFQQAPFVGSIYFSKNTPRKFNVSQQRGAQIATAYPPFSINESVLADESYKNALLVLTSSVYQSIKKGATAKSVPSEFFLTGMDIEESLKIVAERTKVKALLVIIGDGAYVPFSKRFAQGTGNFIASFGIALATAGTTGVGVITNPVRIDSPFISTWTGLIDLQNGEVLWANSIGLGQDPLDEDLYKDEWLQNLFYHFQTRTAGNR